MFKKILKNISFKRGMRFAMSAALVTGLTFTACDFQTVQAKPYKSNSDTEIEIFDRIENRRREERANKLTEEQEKLLADIEEKKSQLPHEMTPDEPIPAAFEGDDLTYNAATGEFIAVGKVDIIQLEGYRFQSDEVGGNVKEQEVRIPGKGHILQLTKGAPRVTLDGYNTIYNYGKKVGTMESANGKAGDYYISGKRFEFYPDHIVIYDASQTKCNAHIPDYHLSADRMEIYPEQIMRMYNVKFWIKNRLVGQKEYEERTFDDKGETYFPRVGYDSDNGAYIEDTFEIPILPHLNAVINAHIETKKGVRSSVELQYGNRNLNSYVLYGFYYDGDNKWIQKKPSWLTIYRKHLDNSPLSYEAKYEIGDWKSNEAASTHQALELNLYHDPIIIDKKYMLLLKTGYTFTKDDVKSPENRGNTKVDGMNYDIKLGREFDDRFAAFIGYNYTRNNSENSLYEYNNSDSYSSKFLAGASYKLTDKDRFVVGLKYNAENSHLEDVDCYWFRDLHCSTAVLRWRAKRHKWELHWQFTPW